MLYLPTFVRDHDPVPAEGWHATGEPYRLYPTLEEAQAAALAPGDLTGRVLVLDDRQLVVRDGATAEIPRAAVLNVDPDGDYWKPVPVQAGGGYVVRREAGAVELLLIFRRGAWDLPKGKLDPGESLEQCAHREVSEEVGVKKKKLSVVADLGETVHGYVWASRHAYGVKTTRWYAMTTTAGKFKPETREGIEAVDWVPWTEAGDRLGFDTLREHLAGIDPETLGV